MTYLQHGLDTPVADLGTCSPDVLSTVVAETSLNELFAVLDQQLPDGLVSDRGDLDELCETVSYLGISLGL